MGSRSGWSAAAGLAIAGVQLMISDAALAQSVQGMEDHNRALVAKGFEAWANGTGSPYDLLAEDASWTITGNSMASRTYPTKEAFMSEVIRPFNSRMQSRLIPSVRKLYAEGNTVIAFFDAQGTARDGKPYANTYAWILEMKDSKIVRATAFFDSIAFDDFWKRVPEKPAP
ncbi:nuclear transport factor 2 family protein [Sphingomonas sp. NSE70-1]|uniref:Nuclear transport factor 2 family protein n=1 Tax=Sphingomonas caseinilyticus TaxID=2908205 RepID=A0ABT0RUK9_9SPHN|nr:nuclear transport factor 2 family protein [Sphingomonas caseinilyticus]MCL6698385.1 nuclear transport factor 2 family protein [Sphingomonas caseinilyticus]